MPDLGWQLFENEKLYFVDPYIFIYTICQCCELSIYMDIQDEETMIWTCHHGPEEDE